MFRKRVRKNFPPGTFIPTPARVAAILQLCIAFTLLSWQATLPFMGDLFATKSQMLVYKHLMGASQQFATLPEKQRTQILSDYDQLQKQLETPFLAKVKKGLQGLYQLPLLEKGWILLALLTPILLLKKVEGAEPLVWLLPLLTLAYAVDNRLQGAPPALTAEQRLFPSEELILNDYLKEPLKPSLAEQHEQLKRGWELYLVQNWGGDFAFTLARLEALKNEPSAPKKKQESLAFLALYLFWNLSFALIVQRSLKKQVDAYAS